MIQVNFGSSKSQDWSGVNVRGVTLALQLQHTTANTAFAANPVDWSLVNLQVVLKRKTGEHIVVGDVALPHVLESGFFSGEFNQNLQIGTFEATVLVAAAMAVDEVIEISANIKFDEIINVGADEILYVYLNLAAGAFGATVDQAASTGYFDIIEGVGMGWSLPMLRAQSVEASVSQGSYSSGDGVKRVTFINTNRAGVTEALNVITQVNMRSDKLNLNDNYLEIVSKRLEAFVSLTEANRRFQSFVLYDEKLYNKSGMPVRLDKVVTDLNFDQTLVTASKNWVHTRSLKNDAIAAQRAAMKFPGQRQENVNAPFKA